MKPKLIILIGNIGSGKSTITKHYQKNGFVVIAKDQLRYGIGGGKYVFNRIYEPIIEEAEKVMFKAFCRKKVNLVIDDVNITKQLRAKFISCAKNYGYHISAIVLPRLTMEESVNRRLNDPHGIFNKKTWQGVWTFFNLQYQKPEKQEGFDQILTVPIKGDPNDFYA